MALLGKAVLGVWNEVDPAIEDDFNNWYLHEHIPERVSVPGMLRGRRYRAAEGTPRFMALYEAATLNVLTTGVYRTQLDNPTAWTQRVMPGFRVAQRGICDVLISGGHGVGGAATVFHLRPRDGGEAALEAWARALVPSLLALPQVSAAHVWVGSKDEPSSPTTELALRATADREVAWVLAVEATVPEALTAVRAAVDRSNPLARGAAACVAYPVYQLLYVMDGTAMQGAA